MDSSPLADKFRAVKKEFDALTFNDNIALVVVGAKLEEADKEIPESLGAVRDLVHLVLEGLMEAFQRGASPSSELGVALKKSFDACLEAVEAGVVYSPLHAAGADLWQKLGNPAAACPFSPSSVPPPPDPSVPTITLDDAACQIMQLEPDNKRDIEKLMVQLKALSGVQNGEARTLLTDAAARLEAAGSSSGDAASKNIAEAGDLIGRAIAYNLIGGEEPAQEPAPASIPPQPAVQQPQPQASPAAAPAPVPDTPAPAASSASAAPQQVAFALPKDIDPNLVNDFYNETMDYLTSAEGGLLALESNPKDMDSINAVFRAFHTIKGMAGFLNLSLITDLSHRTENVLSNMRSGEVIYSRQYADIFLASIDILKELTESVKGAMEGKPMFKPASYDQLIASLVASSTQKKCVAPQPAQSVSLEKPSETPAPVSAPETKLEPIQIPDAAVPKPPPVPGKFEKTAVETSVRVRTDRLDRLINLVGELVISHTMIAQDEEVVSGRHIDLIKKISHTGKIVRELQDLSMSMRMIPLKATFQKMGRLVRDLSTKSSKPVDLHVSGEDTEIDRNMVDVLDEFLVHMVRNSVDHGIEPTHIRVGKGKPAKGSVRLNAYHSGGNVVFEIEDDGRGLDTEKLLEKALSKGLIATADGMKESDIFNLIFVPGFSTAEKITDISGRGVGMDVVKKGVESHRGKIEIESELGKGCKFTIRLPLTMAITDGMIVRAGTERYIIPTQHIRTTLQPRPEDLKTVAGHGEMLVFLGDVIPIFRLYRIFDIKGAVDDPLKGLLVVFEDNTNKPCAFLVDELLGQHQVVAKSLGEGLGKIQGVAGGAILGDGRVGLILDPSELADLARG